MANRRCLHAVTRQYASILSSSNPSFQSPKTLIPALEQTLAPPNILPLQPAKSGHIFTNLRTILYPQYTPTCHFSSRQSDDSDREEEEGEEEEEDDDGDDDDYGSDSVSNCAVKREYTLEEKEKEAAAIGYKVIGPLERSDKVFKPYEPAFAVVQIGSHQFKVSNGDSIYTERLKFCEVNDKLILNRVLMLGSQNQTIIGRPILPDAAVHAVVEEHALDAKVIIFKKKRRKNYRRTKGHRQELTKLRITDIQGIEKPQLMSAGKIEKSAVKKPEKVAVPA
ncbi:50S ribosomal protein L21, mitochondrial [Diospyros lotus]|uniref:50S ribosomal protein L21, mitochondrial n=1 Tax=Diospyros lotus TaxID=55363 RepID=UPI002258589A|nr:50S ribosomal protein L21, mitochondrial [Diospyros lotus]